MNNRSKTELLISVVSHNQGQQVKQLLDSIEKHCNHDRIAVVLTLNVAEDLPFDQSAYPFSLSICPNQKPEGFGANHNKAFNFMNSNYFCVLNPDVCFREDPFPALIESVKEIEAGVTAPVVYNSGDQLEDSVRMLPTPLKIWQRQFAKKLDYTPAEKIQEVDWIAGIFMLFKSSLFKQLKGFDEKYYLYCEDVDICSRLWLQGKKVLWNSGVVIYHDAQRSSHREWRFLGLHLASLLRLFCSPVYYRRYYQKRFLQG